MKLYRAAIINQRDILLIKYVVFYEANKYSYHAEQNCIINCKNKQIINKCNMLLVRISDTGDAIPCDMCRHMINKYNVKRLYTYVSKK